MQGLFLARPPLIRYNFCMKSLGPLLFDLFCVSTVIGIWPRFIEPTLLSTTRKDLVIKGLKKKIELVQISDLHIGDHTTETFLKKITEGIQAEKPDIIVLTGDFLCYGVLKQKPLFEAFLKSLQAPLGVFAIWGNHDYSGGITVNKFGEYDLAEKGSTVAKGFKLLFSKQKLKGVSKNAARQASINPELLMLLEQQGVTVLEDRTVQAGGVNLTGVREYMTSQIDLRQAFADYDSSLPGILLAHNPDAIPDLLNTPSQLIFSGHTHGGQINLPWFRSRFTLMEYPRYFTGWMEEKGKTIYISRGVGSVMPFRFMATPELVHFTLLPES